MYEQHHEYITTYLGEATPLPLRVLVSSCAGSMHPCLSAIVAHLSGSWAAAHHANLHTAVSLAQGLLSRLRLPPYSSGFPARLLSFLGCRLRRCGRYSSFTT